MRDVDVDAQAQPDQLAHQPERALEPAIAATAASSTTTRRTARRMRRVAHRSRRSLRRDDRVHDQLADVGHERRQRGRDDREDRQHHHPAGADRQTSPSARAEWLALAAMRVASGGGGGCCGAVITGWPFMRREA